MFFLATKCVLPQLSQTFQHVAIVGLRSARFRLIEQGQHLEITLVFAPLFPIYLHHPRACSIIPHIGLCGPCGLRYRRASKSKCYLKSLVARQKARLPATLASLNNGHNFDLCACCVGMKSSFRPSLVPTKPLRLRSVAWWFSLVANFNNIVPGCAPIVWANALSVPGHCRVVTTNLAHNLIWPCNIYVLNRCTNSFLVLPSLA